MHNWHAISNYISSR